MESGPTAAYPGAKEDQQTGGHQIDQTCHLHIGSSFLGTMQLSLISKLIESMSLA